MNDGEYDIHITRATHCIYFIYTHVCHRHHRQQQQQQQQHHHRNANEPTTPAAQQQHQQIRSSIHIVTHNVTS